MFEVLAFGDAGWGDEILFGAQMTVFVAVAAFFIGTVFGSLGAAMKLSRFAPLRGAADAYTTLVRGVPELLVIYLLYFGGNGLVMAVASLWGHEGYIDISPFTVGAFAVGLVSGAYSTEVIRGAVQAVPPGQIEAARACGMGRWLIFRRILVPQALRFAVPGMGNVWQFTLKDTALISVTGLDELLRRSYEAGRNTHEPFVSIFSAAVLFLAITSVSGVAFRRLEAYANRGVRRA